MVDEVNLETDEIKDEIEPMLVKVIEEPKKVDTESDDDEYMEMPITTEEIEEIEVE